MTTTTPRRSLATDRDNVRTSQEHTSGFGLPRIVTTVPMNLLSSINPFAAADQSKPTKETETGAQQSNLLFKRPALISLLGGRTQSTGSKKEIQGKGGEEDGEHPHLRQRSTTVMFAEPELTDSDNASRDESVTDEIRRQRRRNRSKTTFSICHPPPASLARHKLHRRPRSLLQLHRLMPNSRPVPAYEVIPSANFSVRLVKSITKVYKAKHGLCINDFVILRAEKYYTQDNEEEQEEQDIVALICRGRANDGAGNGRAKICMANGEEWEAYPYLNSGYEFFTTDDHGLAITVRWVPKRSKDARSDKQKRFQFSTIAQNTRKHPVIASLTNTGLDINDTYKIPDPAVSTPLSTPKNADSFLTAAMENDEDTRGHDDCVTDERLRSIISVTAIWVTFQEGWSPYYKNEDKECNGSQKASSPRKDGLESPADTPPGSPAQYALDKRGSIRSVGSDLMRRSSLLSSRALRSNRNSTLSVDSITSNDTATDVSVQSPTTKHNRARSDSASTVLVHRAASNRRRNNKQATWRPDLLDAQHAVPEASREDLSRVPSRQKSKRMSTIDSLGSPASKRSGISPLRAPDADEDSDDSGSAHSQAERDKRESSATENTSSSEHGESSKKKRKSMPKMNGSPAAKKSGGWKKLLCIR